MAQKAILEKLARNADIAGLTVLSRSATSVVIDNGSNDFTITLVDMTIGAPMGGIDPNNAPYLGIGVAAPCTIKMKSAISTAGTIADVLDSVIAAKVYRLCCGFANDVTLENASASFTSTIRGHVDIVGLGQ